MQLCSSLNIPEYSSQRTLALSFLVLDWKIDLFQSCGHCWVFQICCLIEYSILTASSSWASFRSILFLFFIVPVFAWNVPLVALIFLKRSPVFPILLFSSISLYWSHRKSFLSLLAILSVQFNSVAQSCPTLCDPSNHSTPGLPVHHQLPEFTQSHVHRVGDAIQPSHPLLIPFPLSFNLSQDQGLFQAVSSSYQVSKVLS